MHMKNEQRGLSQASITPLIVAILLIAATLILGVFAVVDYFDSRARGIEVLTSQVKISTEQLASGLALPVWNLDEAQISRNIKALMREPQISGVSLETTEHHYDFIRDATGAPTQLRNAQMPSAGEIRSESPISFSGETLGKLTVFASHDAIKRQLASSTKRRIVQLLIIDAALFSVLFLSLRILVIRPLEYLKSYAQSASFGLKRIEALPSPRVRFLGELESLRASLQHMLLLLESRYRDMQVNEERLKLATQAAEIGVWDWDILNNVLSWDDSMYRAYGVSKNQFSGAYDAWSRTLHPEEKGQAEQELQEALRSGREYKSEFRIVRPDGEERIMRADSKTIRDDSGKAVRMIGSNIDITERTLAERELNEYRFQLERLVEERTRELAAARNQAEAANQAKSRFLSNMSHEIRTPMNAILGYAQLMKRMPELKGKLENYVAAIAKSGDHLMSLINDVLEMSKIESGNLAIANESFHVRALLNDIESIFKMRAVEKALNLVFGIDSNVPDILYADVIKVRQVMINIVGNAIKFIDSGSIKINVSIKWRNDQDGLVTISVADTGPGISEYEQDKVFEAFEQTASGLAKGGTGLGMAISRQYARKMNGDVTLQSAAGQGTTVFFTFAASRGNELKTEISRSASKSIVALAAQSLQPKVLIVDDIESNRDILRLMLDNTGFRNIKDAESGEAALQIARGWRPDIVLLDQRMPGMDGLETARALRGIPGAEALRIIIVTASAFEEDRQLAFTFGANGFIRKPFRDQEILLEVQRVLPDVAYCYEDKNSEVRRFDTDPVAHPEAQQPDLSGMDESLKLELAALIERGDVLRFEKRIAEKLKIQRPEAYERLNELVQRFDYANILAILRPTKVLKT